MFPNYRTVPAEPGNTSAMQGRNYTCLGGLMTPVQALLYEFKQVAEQRSIAIRRKSKNELNPTLHNSAGDNISAIANAMVGMSGLFAKSFTDALNSMFEPDLRQIAKILVLIEVGEDERAAIIKAAEEVRANYRGVDEITQACDQVLRAHSVPA
jgi:hypothetical protein